MYLLGRSPCKMWAFRITQILSPLSTSIMSTHLRPMSHNVVLRPPTEAVVVTIKVVDVVILTPVVANIFKETLTCRCQICDSFNHTANTCYQRYSNAPPSPSAHMASYGAPSQVLDWFPDTVATHHVTPDVTSLNWPS